MNTSLLSLMVLAAASPAAAPQTTLYRPFHQFESAMRQDDVPPLVVRAQSPTYFGGTTTYYGAGAETPATFAPSEGPIDLASGEFSQTAAAEPGTLGPFGTPVPSTYQTFQDPFGAGVPGDPWLGGATGAPLTNVNPFGTNPGLYTYGSTGAQPYQYGWTGRYDVGIIPSEGTTGAGGQNFGDWGILEVDTEKELVMPGWGGNIVSIAPQFNYRSWQGPSIGAPAGIPGSLYRLGLGLKLATPDVGGWNVELGFNPAFASDFENTDSEAWQFDGHAVLFWRSHPGWMWAFGAAYWDRVDDFVIPYAGAVWTPNDLWEFRLVFPKPRISMFVGTPFGVPTWLYTRGEFHVESYAMQQDPAGANVQIQVEDWRVLGGLRFETGGVSSFAELGWVFDRDFKFDHTLPNGTIDDALIGRVGIRY